MMVFIHVNDVEDGNLDALTCLKLLQQNISEMYSKWVEHFCVGLLGLLIYNNWQVDMWESSGLSFVCKLGVRVYGLFFPSPPSSSLLPSIRHTDMISLLTFVLKCY